MGRSHAPLRRYLAAALIAAVLPSLLTACSGSPAAKEGSGGRGALLTFASRKPESLNPALVNKASFIPRLAYQALLGFDDTGDYIGILADRFSWDDKTFTAFTVTLRSGLTFSDGDKLDADAVVKSFAYFRTAKGPNSALYQGITATKVSADTVRFKSAAPNPDLEYLLTDQYYGGSIISPTGVDHPSSLETSSHGVGPYVYAEVKAGVEYDLVANKKYPDQSVIHYDKLVLPVMATEAAQTQALLAGQVEMTLSSASASWSDTVSSNRKLSLTVGAPAWNGLEFLDTQGKVVPALADDRVRQAIMYAVDRAAITKAVYGPNASTRVQPANSTWLGFDKSLESTYSYNPSKAKDLLGEAGYSAGLTIPVAVTAGDVSETLLQAVSGYLDKVGITLVIKTATDVGSLIGLLYSGTVAGMALPNAQSSLWQYISAVYLPTSGLNALHQQTPDLNALFDKASRSNAAADWTAVSEYLNKHALTIPISNAPDVWISTKTVDVSGAYNQQKGIFDLLKVKPAS